MFSYTRSLRLALCALAALLFGLEGGGMMLGAKMFFERRGQKLPYDAEVEYLESTGTSWVDTGLPIVNNAGYQCEVEFRFVSFKSGAFAEDWVFGYWNRQPSARMYLIGRYGSYIRGGAGPDSSAYYAQISRDTLRHTIALRNDGAYLDGVRKAPTRLTELPDQIYGVETVRFGMSPHVDSGSTRQLYSCRMWALDGSPIRDYMPVRFKNENGVSEGAMYDSVSGRLFRNRGTRAFVIGPDKTA